MARAQMKVDVSDYASDRVFDGVRPISQSALARRRANYKRTHGSESDTPKQDNPAQRP